MKDEKQIEEMARFMCHCYDEGYCRMDGKLCDLECGSYKESEIFYEAGYRRQAEGEWIDKPTGAYSRMQSWCSSCGKHSGIGGIESNRHKPYCPNCGAHMRGGKNE